MYVQRWVYIPYTLYGICADEICQDYIKYSLLGHTRKLEQYIYNIPYQAVQKMYGIPLTSYPDLAKTGQELGLLQTLYDLYQKYIDFDVNFKAALWQDVNLNDTTEQV